jgi:hypothetical protein
VLGRETDAAAPAMLAAPAALEDALPLERDHVLVRRADVDAERAPDLAVRRRVPGPPDAPPDDLEDAALLVRKVSHVPLARGVPANQQYINKLLICQPQSVTVGSLADGRMTVVAVHGQASVTYYPNDDEPCNSRVAEGGCPPPAPTDPDVRD